MSKRSIVVVVLVTLGLISSGRHVWAQSDQIQLSVGSRLNGTIKSTSPVAVTLEANGAERPIPVNEIKIISFKEDPADLKSARSKIIGGRIDQGLAELKRVNPGEIKRDLVLRDLQFYLAYATGKQALSSGGDKTEATSMVLAFVRADPTSHHFFEAAELLGDLAFARGDFADASKYYSAISAKAPWPESKMHAAMLEAKVFIAMGDFPKAQQKYAQVMSSTSDSKDAQKQKRLAEVGAARCLAETGSAEEAIGKIEAMIAKNDSSDTELFGRAYNAMGDCLRRAGKTRDALLAYLHVDVLFYADPDIHAEALSHLTKLWTQTNHPDRAAAAKKILQERYAGSRWAGQLDENL